MTAATQGPATDFALTPGSIDFRRLLECLPTAAYTCDRLGLITWFNERAVEMWGRRPTLNGPADRFCGSFRLYSREGAAIEHRRSWVALALEQQREFSGEEIVIEREDGSRRVALVHVSPLYDSQGELAGAVNVFVDVSNQKRAEDVVRESEERFARFMEHLPGLAWIKDADGRYVYVNDAAEQAFGQSRDRLYGRRDEDIFPPETAAQFQQNDQEALTSERGLKLVETLKHRDGMVHHSIVSKFPIPGTAGSCLVGGIAIDITQRKLAEERLRESQTHLWMTTEAARVGTWEWDLRSGEVMWSTVHKELFGFEPVPGVITYDDWARRLHPEDLKSAEAAIEKCLRGEERYEIEYRIVPIGMSGARWIRSKGRMEYDDHGRAVRVQGVSFDVTDRKQAELALRERETELDLVARTTPLLLARCSRDLQYLFVNRAAADLFGLTPEEMVGRPIVDIMGARAFEVIRPYIDRVLRGESVEYEAEIPYISGPRWMRINYSPNRDELGAVIGWVASIMDVTARKDAEEALRESEQRFRMLADNAPVLIWINDLSGCEFVNRAYLEFVGLSVEQVRGANWTKRLHPRDADAYLTAYRRAEIERGLFEAQCRLLRADGEYRWLKSAGVPRFASTGELLGYVGCSVDITEMKNAEGVLRDADRRKDEFLATLAHELRNPLASIRTGLELARLRGEDSQLMEEVRAAMERQTTHLVRLVDDLLDVGRITSGKVTLRKERVELKAIVESAVESASQLIAECGHELRVSLPPRPVRLEVDSARLTQILWNLLSNAAKYTDRGGRISVTADLEGECVRISVKDTGIGIEPEMLERVFDMFAQAKEAVDRSRSGLGIGLTLVKRLVEMHGGTVRGRSDGPGRGSEFILRLPVLSCPAVESAQPGQHVLAANEKLRVLIAEDNEDAARMLGLAVRTLGHEVSIARDGVEALEIAERFHPRIVLMDIGMPRLNGYETAKRMRIRWGSDLVLAALTGWGQDEDRQRTRDAGFDHHLVKPAELSEIQRIIADAE